MNPVVEKVAEALFRAAGWGNRYPWPEMNPKIQDGYRDMASAAIEALIEEEE